MQIPRKFKAAAAAFIGALLLQRAATAQQDGQPDFRKLYDTYEAAVRKMDSTAYLSMFTQDFAMTDPTGKTHDRAEMEKYQQVNAATTKKVNSYSVTIESVTPQKDGDVALIVLQQYDRDQAPADQPDKPHNIKTSVVQRETWHLDGGSWKIRRIEEILNGPVYFDGKMIQ